MLKKYIKIGSIFFTFCLLGLSFSKIIFKQHFFSKRLEYSIFINGVSSDSFPPKGNYSVNVKCNNSEGKWDYDNWKLYISGTNIIDKCNIEFNKITKFNYLNEHVKNLSAGTCSDPNYFTASICETNGGIWSNTIADGYCTNSIYNDKLSCESKNSSWYNIVHEQFNIPADNAIYTSATNYNNINYISGESYYGLNDGVWTATGTSENKYRYVSFSPSSNGYYKLQCTLPAGTTSNVIFIYLNDSTNSSDSTVVDLNYVASISGSTNEVNGEYYLGYLTTNDVIKIGIRYNSGNTFYLEKTNQLQTIDTGYRYEGSNPNNYVFYNNELWRIIGIFETTLADGTTKQILTKIIRNESIGSYAFDSTSTNAWINTSEKKSDLNVLLNDYYYEKINGTSSGSCHFYAAKVNKHCDFSRIGLYSEYRNMVENVIWSLGGSSSSTNPNNMYIYERSTTIPSDNVITSTGHIGLMYPSDYGYSVLSSSCPRNINLSAYNSETCAGKAWMLQNSYEWTLTPNSSYTNRMWYVYRDGSINYYYSNEGYAVRPVLYLKSSTYIVSGEGTITNPYILGL